MPTGILAIVNGIVFTISIWFSHVSDFSQWWHWFVLAVLGMVVMYCTAVKGLRANRQAHEQAEAHRFSEEKLIELENAVSRIENREHRDAVIKAVAEYYEEIIKIVGDRHVAAPALAIATRGFISTSGSVRDIIPKPQFGGPNDDVRSN